MLPQERKKILIIEDDLMLNKIYQTKLDSLGYFVYSAYDGEEGVEKARETNPDLILLDLMLPKKSGFEVLEILKHNIILNRVPVIIMSNLGQKEDIGKGVALGATDFLVKSNVKLETIVSKIDVTLQGNTTRI